VDWILSPIPPVFKSALGRWDKARSRRKTARLNSRWDFAQTLPLLPNAFKLTERFCEKIVIGQEKDGVL
jgi:hypothetical protein